MDWRDIIYLANTARKIHNKKYKIYWIFYTRGV